MDAIRIIQDEHFAIAAVLHALRYHVREIREGGSANFALLRAILDYIVSYPDRWHHPKEDKFLFAALRRHSPEAEALVARLEREHVLGHPMIATLGGHLACFQAGDPGADQAFFAAAEAYVEFEYTHMRTETEQVIPLAEKLLSPEEWQVIDQAFAENDNPLFGIKPKDEAETLYRRILDLAPPPIGY